LLIVVAIATLVGGAALARNDPEPSSSQVTLARLRWGADLRGFRPGVPTTRTLRRGVDRGGFSAAWNHDYPRAEQHLSLIIKDITLTDIRTDADVVVALDDPRLFQYPIALMWEPGFWSLTDREAEAFRAYLLKGGFAIFEDFDGAEQWNVFESQMRRVLPESRLVKLEQSHMIFDSFFRIKDIEAILHPMYGLKPSYYGIFEDDDPAKRLLVVANFDNDVPEYWEWSGQGVFAFDTSNEAYKLGVNYVVYGLTH
jgi:hypothetical protein